MSGRNQKIARQVTGLTLKLMTVDKNLVKEDSKYQKKNPHREEGRGEREESLCVCVCDKEREIKKEKEREKT